MALLIERDINIFGDITISQLYVRLMVHNGPEGSPLIVTPLIYSSKESYDLNPTGNQLTISEFPGIQQFEYNREIDGSDVLGFAHNKLREVLITDETEEDAVADPSTGEYPYDPSTGQLILETVIVTPKFTMDSSISIVDISIL